MLLDNMQPWACLLLLLCQLSPPLHHQRASASCPAAVIADWPVCVVITLLWHGFSLLSRWLNNAVKLLTYNLGGSPEDNIIFYVAAFVGPHWVFPSRARTIASYGKLTRPFWWSTRCCLALCGLRGKRVSLVIFSFISISGQIAIN